MNYVIKVFLTFLFVQHKTKKIPRKLIFVLNYLSQNVHIIYLPNYIHNIIFFLVWVFDTKYIHKTYLNVYLFVSI